MAGSRSPLRVPITSPSSGVKPIEVSTDRPPRTAATEQPLPRWQVIIRRPGVVGPADQRGQPAGDEPVRGPVEPVAADAVPLVQHVGQRVEEAPPAHGLVERGVEDGDLGHLGQQVARRAVALDVGRVVQRSELEALFDPAQDRVVDEDRGPEALAAVDHAVAHGLDLARSWMTAVPPGSRSSSARSTATLCSRISADLPMRLSSRPPAQEGRTADVLDEAAGQDPVLPPRAESSSVSRSWNLTDELPQLRTRTFTATILRFAVPERPELRLDI